VAVIPDNMFGDNLLTIIEFQALKTPQTIYTGTFGIGL